MVGTAQCAFAHPMKLMLVEDTAKAASIEGIRTEQ
jgi:hypothetical protein